VTILGPDLRESGDGKQLGLAKAVAGLIGISPDDIVRRAERTRRRRNRVWAGLASLFLILAVVATGSAVYAWQQLKTNEAFLDATLERFTGLVGRAVSLSRGYSVPLPVTLGFLKEAEGLLDVMARHSRPTPKLAYRKALMLGAFADNYRDLGQTAEWESRAAEARWLMSELVMRDPANVEWAFELTFAHRRYGELLVAKGDLAGALVEHRARQQIIERLAKAEPNNASLQHAIYDSLWFIADVESSQGSLASALTNLRRGHEVMERLAKADINNADWQRDLSVSYNKIGVVLVEQGNLAEALTSFRESLTIFERLSKANPNNPGRQRDLAAAYAFVGNVLLRQGLLDEALRHFRADLAITERLTKTDPTNTEWQASFAVAYEKIGNALQAQGNDAEALTSFRESLSIRERLAQADPNNAVRQREVYVSLWRNADVEISRSNLASALTNLRRGQEIMERLTKADPGNAGWQRDLSVSYGKLGDVLAAQGHLAEALTSFRESLVIFERLARGDPTNVEWQYNVIVSHWRLARHGDEPARRWAFIVVELRKLKDENRLRPELARLLPVAEEQLARFKEAQTVPQGAATATPP
jgi:tetratricopeptide (TPR) repeat protein